MDQEHKADYGLHIRPMSHKIRVKFFLEEGRLIATDEIHLQRLADAWGDIRFVLWHQLKIDELMVDGRPAQFTYGQGISCEKLEIVVSKKELPQGKDHVRLTISYAGKPYYEQWGAIRATINPEIASLNPSYFPWYPQFSKSMDSIADVTFIVPKGYTVVASGELVGVKAEDDDWDQWTWHTDVSGERFSFAIAQYTSRSTSIDGIPVSVHLHSEDAHRMDELFEETKDIFTFCSERLGRYPLEKFAIAGLPQSLRGAGGYGEESFIKMRLGPLINIRGFGLAHEIAHAWVLRATSERGGLWLLESLGEYVSHLYEETAKGSKIAQNIRAAWAMKYFDRISRIDDYPLMDYRSEDMESDHYFLYYDKGAWIWHILRQVLGDDVFHKVLLEFHYRYILRHVTVDNFRAVYEELSGRSLAWFFQEWLERPGVPILELADISIEPMEDGFMTTGTLGQHGEIYHLPVEIGIQMEGQSEIRRIWVESDETQFEFKTAMHPKELVLEPNINLLRAPNPGESLEAIYDTGWAVPFGRGGGYWLATSDDELEIFKKMK